MVSQSDSNSAVLMYDQAVLKLNYALDAIRNAMDKLMTKKLERNQALFNSLYEKIVASRIEFLTTHSMDE